jgi:hypothetical protein
VSADIIAARRQQIQDNAKCDGCGATLAECKAERGKDPTAPEWFGCCSTNFGPCRHRVDAADLLALLREVESGTVRTVEEAAPKQAPAKSGMSWFEYLTQDKQWQPNGKPPVAIADMEPEWRYNAARYLERHAAVIGQRYSLAATVWFAAITSSPLGPSENAADGIQSDMEREEAEIARDPVAWIRTTKLHRALVDGLPTKPKKVAALAERARHWSTCPARTGDGDCRCEELQQAEAGRTHLSECPVADGRPELGCRCGDTTPEWTLS